MSESHPHTHEHGGRDHDEHARGLGHLVRDLFAPHSHDAKDSLDQALEGSRDGVRAVAISLVILLLTAGVQALVVVVSGSVALLGDTFHNGADALTALPLWMAFSLGRRPATERFTYGFGKAEDIAGLAVVGFIALSAASGRLRGHPPSLAPSNDHPSADCHGRGDRGSTGERGRGAVPNPDRTADRISRSRGRRASRPNGRHHVIARAHRSHRRRVGTPVGRPGRGTPDHGRHFDRPLPNGTKCGSALARCR